MGWCHHRAPVTHTFGHINGMIDSVNGKEYIVRVHSQGGGYGHYCLGLVCGGREDEW